MITVDDTNGFDKTTMKDLLNCNQNKEALAIFLTTQLIEKVRKTRRRRT